VTRNLASARRAGAFPRTGRGKSAAPGFNVHSKIAPSPPSARRRWGKRATSLRAARRSVSAGAGEVSIAPRRNGRGLWGYAPACCDRLCQSVPSSTLAVRRLYVTKDGSPTRRPTSLMELPCHASSTSPQAVARGVLALSLVVGLARVRARADEAGTRGCRVGHVSFRDRRPVRPWFVVNPGEGTASPWASWSQPSSENNFPAAARLPRAANSFRFQVLHAVATAARCGPPIPRRPDHNKDALARPCLTRKEKHHG
jgi:hypothetical protein